MKFKIITLLCGLLHAVTDSKAQYVTLIDTVFRNELVKQFPVAFNGAKQLDTTNAVILSCTSLTVHPADVVGGDSILSVTGVGFFKALQTFDCSKNKITQLPALPGTLVSLNCQNNHLSTLPALPSTLFQLICSQNKLTVLPSLPVTLNLLVCSNNQLTALPTLPMGLQLLYAGSNMLTTVPALPLNLKFLQLSDNLVTSLPALPSGLENLVVDSNELTVLPTSLPASLKFLACDINNLTALPAMPSKLEVLSCTFNKITTLPVLPIKMKTLLTGNNLITSYPTLPDSITLLDCKYNPATGFTNLPFALESLYCESNNLTTFPALPSRLNLIAGNNNKITTLPPLPVGLRQLTLDNNLLTAVPALSDSLRLLSLSGNKFSALPALPSFLQNLVLNNNYLLASLPALPDSLWELGLLNDSSLFCLPFLPARLNSLLIPGTKITCLPNLPFNCNPLPALPICNATNNNNQCQSFPQVYGFVFNDNNSNGIYDNGDVQRTNVKALLSNGAYSYTNTQGNFNIAADTIGSYNVTLINPAFYMTVPITFVHNLPTYTSEVYDTFALQPNVIKDSLGVHITSYMGGARPGFAFAYQVNYDNPGTTVLSPDIVVRYDGSKLMYDSSSVPGVVNMGDSLILNAASTLPGSYDKFVAYFTVKTSAVLGMRLYTSATATALSASYTDTSSVLIRGSFDPNDKQATPAMTPVQVASGNLIDYTIRFQNTGTDTAFTVVIADTLSQMLQNNVLRIIGSSHLCRTTLNNGIIYFEFLNIALPDSGTNYLKSNGFVRFKIQPQTTVVLGDIIPNHASIYFDYNTPVLTNTVETHIQATLLPLRLLDFNALLLAEKKVMNNWITVNERNTAYFNVQRSTNGKDFSIIGKVNATGGEHTQHYSYLDETAKADPAIKILYYRLQMVDKDGSLSYSKAATVRWLTGDAALIYPNPAHDCVTVQGSNIQSIKVVDNAGRVVLNKGFKDQNTIKLPVNHLAKGLYLLQVTGKNKSVQSEKLIVE